jgi:hypothetical protein
VAVAPLLPRVTLVVGPRGLLVGLVRNCNAKVRRLISVLDIGRDTVIKSDEIDGISVKLRRHL